MKGRIVTALRGLMTLKDLAESLNEEESVVKPHLDEMVKKRRIFKDKDQYSVAPFKK